MKIRTKRLILRPIERSDAARMKALLTNDVIARTYMLPDFADEAQITRLFERFVDLSHGTDRVVAGIDLGGTLIGWINDVGIEDGVVELGYVMDPVHQGNGYMTEALGAMIAALLENGYRQVVCGAFEENAASIRVMEKCGMRRTEKTETVEYREKTHDCVYYALRREERKNDMDHVEKARNLFLEGYSCSQAVFGAFAPELGLDHETAMKLASSFGGGLGGSRELCGAVSGMLMVAGLKWGYFTTGDLAVKTAHYQHTRELLEAFKTAHGTTVCRELLSGLETLKADPSERTPEYYKTRPCVRFVETAAALLEAEAGKRD